jgi:NADH dehydrogenase
MVNSQGQQQVAKKLVIVGGGFGGINLALHLKNDPRFNITLVDKNNYNFFPPLIYQVATGFLENSNISYPFRKLFRRYSNIHFRLGELIKVNPESHTIQLNNGEIKYDYLVFATGAVSNYFGMENIRKNAIPMKMSMLH